MKKMFLLEDSGRHSFREVHPPKFFKFMYYVYILLSNIDKNLYIGCTNNLKERLLLHNSGKVFSTKNRMPLQLIHYEAFIDKTDAFDREKWLKTGWGHNQINKILYNTLKNSGG